MKNRYRETCCDVCLEDIMWDSHMADRLEVFIICSECAAKTDPEYAKLVEEKRKQFESCR